MFTCAPPLANLSQPWCMPNEVMSDMYYPIYPEGMYQAIKRYVRVVLCHTAAVAVTLLLTPPRPHQRTSQTGSAARLCPKPSSCHQPTWLTPCIPSHHFHFRPLPSSCHSSSAYGIPMYITETGIADARDDRRALLIDSYFKEVCMRVLGGGFGFGVH